MEFIGRNIIYLLEYNSFIQICPFFRISTDLNEMYQMSSLVNFFCSTAVICTMGFMVMITEFSLDMFIFASSVVTLSLQIYFMAWIADKLTEMVSLFFLVNYMM